jgi:hypothetical protein
LGSEPRLFNSLIYRSFQETCETKPKPRERGAAGAESVRKVPISLSEKLYKARRPAYINRPATRRGGLREPGNAATQRFGLRVVSSASVPRFGIAGWRFGLWRARWRGPFDVKGWIFDIVEKRKGCAGGGAFGAVRMRISKEVNSEPMQVVRCQDFAGRSARKDRRG